MTPHLRLRQISARHVLLPLAIWSMGGLLPTTLAAPVPADKPTGFPAWWFERDVIPRINPAITTPLWASNHYLPSDDFAMVNEGQFKTIVKAAVDELNLRLPDVADSAGVSDGAGRALNELVAKWAAAPLPGVSRQDYAVVNLGQVKAVADLFYDRLIDTDYYMADPWTGYGTADDFAAVNLGQLKHLFSFDVSGLRRELWTGISGTAIGSIPLTTTPTSSSTTYNLLESLDAGDNYGERINGYLTVPTTGIYRFWLTASGSAELYVSNDDDPRNSFLRASVTTPTALRAWTDANAGKSQLLWLEAGQRYYLEVRHKAGTGTDHVSVGWLTAGSSDPASVTTPTEVVPASALSRRPTVLPAGFTPPSPLTWTDPNSSGNPESHLNANAATRFLMQATYGPSGWSTDATYGATGGWTGATIAGPGVTPYDVGRVQSLGFSGWIDEQMNTSVIPQTRLHTYVQAIHPTAYDPSGNNYWHEQFYSAWWRTAVTARDQLRQRVAFALSEIMVISNMALNPRSDACSDFYDDALAANAFGNFRDILRDVTLHPAMGLYLDMLRNNKPDADPAVNPNARVPNENYARELLQLFSIGTHRLNPDGTTMLDDDGNPIPTYDQEVVEGLAHVFTGWDYAYDVTGYNPNRYNPWYDTTYAFASSPYTPQRHIPEYINPMLPVPDRHFTGTKRILNNVVLPGLTTAAGVALPPYGTPTTAQKADSTFQALPTAELNATLDAIFNHPNCGPFIGRQLIQRLVTSNPSDAYVYRVASAFNDDGTSGHVRGNMAAVVKAILLDPEARAASSLADEGFGKQREPLLRFTAFARAFPSLEYTGTTPVWVNQWKMGQTSYTHYSYQENINQTPLGSPSVFNFFRPDYKFPGILAQAGLTTPEFQLTTDTSVIDQANFVHNALVNWGSAPSQGLVSFLTSKRDILLDLRPWMASTSNANLGGLIDELNNRLMAGQMPSTGTNVYHPAGSRSIVNAKQALIDFIGSKGISAVSAAGAGDITITTSTPHGLTSGEKIFFNADIGGSFTPALYGGYPRPSFVVTVTGSSTFTIPVVRAADSPWNPLNLTNGAISHLPYDTPYDRLVYLLIVMVNTPDYIIQR